MPTSAFPSSIAATAVTACAVATLSLLALHNRNSVVTTLVDAVEDRIFDDVVGPSVQRSEINSYYSRFRQFRQRKSWKSFQDYLTDRQFRRYFRMSKETFKDLCECIADLVLKYSLKMNCKIIDACMRLHNFILDRRQDNSYSNRMDADVFDDDCRRFFAVNSFLVRSGVHGGEDDVCRDGEGNVS